MTGVQTCALPICRRHYFLQDRWELHRGLWADNCTPGNPGEGVVEGTADIEDIADIVAAQDLEIPPQPLEHRLKTKRKQ